MSQDDRRNAQILDRYKACNIVHIQNKVSFHFLLFYVQNYLLNELSA